MSGGIYNAPDGQQLHGDGKPVFRPESECMNDLVMCFQCDGKGWYSFGSRPDEHYKCHQCEGVGKVTQEKRKEAVEFFNKTKLSWEKAEKL